ncbi:MarR family transcriptional regulator [Microbacterium sp. CFH 31415]|uniref:MarR family winged helix-turn-helix transcriptional regulator n=1 Tax=Microbacterium sp. CFH 31415 TaxID=2921732 RepID=UPI001F147BCE|nr:MarR family transcriptional regulator [Microbacterium sp. CFH 31415]MCH6231202.1 MarR family transcriptional regulator [Microbacterium sp. CFH 31415]
MAYQVPRMDELQSRAWLALVWTAELLPAALDAQLQADSDMTHFEFMVLSTLQQAKDAALRTTDLAAAVNSTMPRLSRVVGKLAERGLVERRGADGDARVVIVHLTSAGRRELVRAVPRHIDRVKDLVIDRLTPDELEGLTAALEPLVERLDPQHRVGFGERRGTR